VTDLDALLQLEARRCAAISALDEHSLRDTLAEDYVHIHATGTVDDREGFIRGVLANPRIVERGTIHVRLYGEMAVLTGEQTNHRGGSAALCISQQIAARREDIWRFVSAQVTRIVGGNATP
jgi:hypothetical protein